MNDFDVKRSKQLTQTQILQQSKRIESGIIAFLTEQINRVGGQIISVSATAVGADSRNFMGDAFQLILEFRACFDLGSTELSLVGSDDHLRFDLVAEPKKK